MKTDPHVPNPPAWLARHPVTQTWAEHIRHAGPWLGGTDWDMPTGTAVFAPPGGGIVEHATPESAPWPSWYNAGLGTAIAVRRPDGCRTVMGHLSAFATDDGATIRSGDLVAESGDTGKSSGPHLHGHDVFADGRTRTPMFSTITPEWAAADLTPIETAPAGAEKEDDDMTLRGITWYKVTDRDGTNWLVPDTINSDGTPHWRIITEDATGSGQAEVNGVTAALGYGPAIVTRPRFNALAATRA